MNPTPTEPGKKPAHPWRIVWATLLGWLIAGMPAWLEEGSGRQTVFHTATGSIDVGNPNLSAATLVIVVVVPFSFMVAMLFTGWGKESFWDRLMVVLGGSALMFMAWLAMSFALICLAQASGLLR